MKKLKYLLIILAVSLTGFSPAALAVTTAYVQKVIPNGIVDGNPQILASDGSKFVWAGNPPSQRAISALYYFDGSSNNMITTAASGSSIGSAAVEGNYIAYVLTTQYTQTIGGVNYGRVRGDVYLYNLQTQQSQQITPSDVSIKEDIKLSGGHITWLQSVDPINPTTTYEDVWVYDISSMQLTDTTNNGNQNNYISIPAISSSGVYWTDVYRNLNRYDFITQTISVIQSDPHMSPPSVDGQYVTWNTDGKGEFSGGNVYLFDGNNISVIDQNDNVGKLNIKGNLVVWLSSVNSSEYKVYNIANGTTQTIPLANGYGAGINTDGQRVIYVRNIAYGDSEPTILDTTTGLTTNISYPNGFVAPCHGTCGDNDSLLVISQDLAAWAGYHNNNCCGSQYFQINVAQAQVVSDVPTGLTIPSPTNQPNLSWNAAPNTSGYNIYRDGAFLGSTSATSYSDSSASSGNHAYYVTALNSGGESGPSNSVTVLVDKTPPVVTGAPDRAPNAVGWYKAPATITWSAIDPAPSSGTPTVPAPTTANIEGNHTYTSGQSCDPAGNCATGSLALSIDTVKPGGTYAGNALILRLLGQKITGTATDATSGVARVSITSNFGNITLNSGTGGAITLSCNATKINCTYSANANTLLPGLQTLTLKVTDVAGNVYTTSKLYTIL